MSVHVKIIWSPSELPFLVKICTSYMIEAAHRARARKPPWSVRTRWACGTSPAWPVTEQISYLPTHGITREEMQHKSFSRHHIITNGLQNPLKLDRYIAGARKWKVNTRLVFKQFQKHTFENEAVTDMARAFGEGSVKAQRTKSGNVISCTKRKTDFS